MKANIVTNTVSKIGFQAKKHGPEILMIAGIGGVLTSAVMACVKTPKALEVVEDTKKSVDIIHVASEKGETVTGEEYTKDDNVKDLVRVYGQTGIKLAKIYGPSIVFGTLSIVCLVSSNNILRKRNVAIAAAYATIDKSFKEYRGRVVDRFGEVVDRELKFNTKAEKITVTEIDEETGKEKKVKKTIQVAEAASGYARFFEEYVYDRTAEAGTHKNLYWDENPEFNIMFIKAQQNYANDLLRAKKRLFLNEVYKMLGLPETKAGQVVGWVYDEENPVGDNYVDFGIYSGGSQNYSDFVYGTDGAILLDFNVDGNIWDLM